MPLDINLFRNDRGGDPEKVRESQRRRYDSVEIVDEIISMDNDWRSMTGDIDKLKAKKNAIQKEVGKKKKAKEECDDLISETKALGEEIVKLEEKQVSHKKDIDKKLSSIGNLVEDTVPIHNNEDFNRVERTWGTPRDPEGLLNHHDILWRIGGYEPERGVGVAGHRGYFLTGPGVMLNQAFINYGIAFLRKREYTALQPPYMMKKDVMSGVAQLEQFDEELYKVSGDGDDKYLIATSEQPICAYHKDDWIPEKSLPIRYSGISTCFRKEAGKHGADTWGIFRVHQFEKVEQFVITDCDLEKSNQMQEEMIKTAEEFYQSLGFPYHVINIVTGALNNAAIRKFDLEAWFPGYNAYRELVSCSNCTDYQSRAMEIRCGIKKMGDREKKYCHMLNATLCATGRAICCLLENYQTEDGVKIPDVLVPYMDGITFLPFVRESKEAKKGNVKSTKATSAKNPAAPKAEAAAAAAPNPAVSTAASSGLEAKVKAKGDEVRKAKANKADKETITALVGELKALKVELETETKKAATPVQETLPPKPPMVKPAYTSPAPSISTTNTMLPSSVWDGPGKVDVEKLDRWLGFYSYVGGCLPSDEDQKVLKALPDNSGDKTNVTRWRRNITNITN